MRIQKHRGHNNLSLIFLFTGILLLVLSILYNKFLISLIVPNPPLEPVTAGKIVKIQLIFLLTGILFITFSKLICLKSLPNILQQFFRREFVAKLAIFFLTLFLPIYTLELCLRPIANLKPKRNFIFIKDSELGWKHRPNVEDNYSEVKIRINSKGLRGPELKYTKDPNHIRILYLGDSVTFGVFLSSYKETFPYVIESILENKLGKKIETINAGVSGYSAWQEFIYLKKEGIKYSPDLVVVSFVLNDVTEPINLIQFGGTFEGHQLSRSYYSLYDWLKHNSSTVYFIDKLSARLRFGVDVQKGAEKKEFFNVKSLIYDSDNPKIKQAWDRTLKDLQGIYDFCKEHRVPVLMVIFPYTFQFEDIDALSTPQRIVSRHAISHGVEVIDLLPILSKIMASKGVTPANLFLDKDHLTSYGCEVVAEIIANYVQKNYLAKIIQQEEK